MELAGSAAFSQLYDGGTIRLGLESGDHPNLLPGPLREPDVSAAAFLEPGRIARELQRHPSDRYLTFAPPAAYYVKGYLWTRGERDWPALENERGTLFGIPDVLGYNPVQLPRYWSWIRAVNPLPIFYNASVLPEPTLEQMRLLGARFLIVPEGVPLPRDIAGRIVTAEGGYRLYEIFGWQPRASVVGDWRVVPDPAEALRVVVDDGFDPSRLAVLERDPGIPPPAPPPGEAASRAPGTATYREAVPEDVRITVDANAPSIVVVRNNWDAGWSATVDGRPAPVLRADYFRQGVPVPPGRHRLRLVYRDPLIARGLVASGIVWSMIVVAFLAALAVERRARRRAPHRGEDAGAAPRRGAEMPPGRPDAVPAEVRSDIPSAGVSTDAVPDSAGVSADGHRRFGARRGLAPAGSGLSRSATEREREAVQGGGHHEEVSVADDDGAVLEHSADHRAEQVRSERDRRRSDVAEPLGED